MEIIGTTIDDAAGEAFDKTGKMLQLPYPAGPVIDKLAKDGKAVFDFPEPKIQGLDFSFRTDSKRVSCIFCRIRKE